MADEKRGLEDEHGQGHGRLPDHLDQMERTRTDIDVVHVTTANPYTEINFIGTYAAITFATCAAFAGFIMPVTSLTLINVALGKRARILSTSIR